ncbi:MAG: SDR family NAD(P)-dependent oxidoreductase [Candidatus Dadabacteria bacterium]|nr:MAG: SDR family NAD(P)-dependent oxidoreductase [Candidatus Dadabacteria bacterium]
MRFPNQIRTFITGAGSGLGREMALVLAERHQARLLLGDIDTTAAEETARLVHEMGGQAQVLNCDVRDPEALAQAARKMDERWGGTDLLINNAGISAAGTIGDFSLDDWRWCLEINLWGVIHGCHAFAPAMRERGNGWILNVASNAAIASLPEMGPYNVSKAGVLSLSETLRGELGAHGVSVTVLCPTFFPSNLLDRFRSSHDRQRKMAESMFRRATATTREVAVAGLNGCERGRFLIIPQRDGRLIWHAKRVAPEALLKFVTERYRRRVLTRR